MANITFTRIDPKDILRPALAFNPTATDTLVRIGKSKLFNFDSFNEDIPDKQSLLNTPIYDTIIFGNIDGTNQYEDINGDVFSFKPLQIDVAIVTISQTKNVVTTAIQGKNGTIKEFISDGDYQITIDGIIWIDDNIYPEDDVQTLINICKIPQSITIFSRFVNMFGVSEIVITDYSFPQQIGIRNQQSFTINAISDAPINLEEIE
jgi:hypothetical protein